MFCLAWLWSTLWPLIGYKRRDIASWIASLPWTYGSPWLREITFKLPYPLASTCPDPSAWTVPTDFWVKFYSCSGQKWLRGSWGVGPYTQGGGWGGTRASSLWRQSSSRMQRGINARLRQWWMRPGATHTHTHKHTYIYIHPQCCIWMQTV